MGVRRIYQFKQQDLAVANLVITPRSGRGYRIHEIGVTGGGNLQGLIITINDVRTLFVPGLDAFGNVAFPKYISDQTAGFMEQLYGKFPDLPGMHLGADEGMTIELRTVGQPCTAYVWYEELDGGDIPLATDPGGSLSEDRVIIAHTEEQFTIAATSTQVERMTAVTMPAGFRTFPFGEVVPSNRKMDLLGMVLAYDNSSSANTTINGVRIWREEQSILSEDEDFCPITVFPCTDTAQDQRLALFNTPIPFMPSDEMRIEFSCTNAAGAPQTPYLACGLIFHQIPV